MAEVATFLKVGTTALVLALIEDDAFDGRRPDPRQPGEGHPPGVARPDAVDQPIDLADGRTVTALALQWELYGLARKYAEDRGLELPRATRPSARGAPALGGGPPRPRDRPELGGRPGRLGGQAPAARGLPRAPRPRLGRPSSGRRRPAVPRPAARAVPVRPARHREACVDPAGRARRRHRAAPAHPCLFPGAVPQAVGVGSVASANWDSLVFDLGTDPTAARPYDGSASWNSRTCRGAPG